MFRYLEIDPYNRRHRRNISNTNRYFYNCAGYALETFSWYCPHSESDGEAPWGWGWNTDEEMLEVTDYAIKTMLKDFKNRLRVIDNLSQLDTTTERAIAFRVSSDGDFHYIKKCANGQWYHKRGSAPFIERMSEYTVLHSVWCERYDGPLVLFAMKK